MEETVLFKMDVSDESIKREAMKVVWTFPGVTLVNIEEKGIVKVKGIFEKIRMGIQLRMIDESVDFTNLSQKADQKSYLGLTIPSLFTPKPQEMIVFEFKVLNEVIKPKVMGVIWECSGVTSVEVEKGCNIKVKGREFNKLGMATEVKKIDETVETRFEDMGHEPTKTKWKENSKDRTSGFSIVEAASGLGAAAVSGLGAAAVSGLGAAAGLAKAFQKNGSGSVNHKEAQKKNEEGYVANVVNWWKQKPQNSQRQMDKNLVVKAKCVNIPFAKKTEGESSQKQTQNSWGNSSMFSSSKWSTSEGETSDGTTLNSKGNKTTGSSTTMSGSITDSTYSQFMSAAEQAKKGKSQNSYTKKP